MRKAIATVSMSGTLREKLEAIAAARFEFDVMEALGARLMLVCSNTQPNVLPEEERAADQLRELAERAARRNLRIGLRQRARIRR